MTVYMSNGALLQREVTPGGGTYATIPQCMSVTPPKRTRKQAEVYIHDQAAPVVNVGAYEAQTVEFELAWDPGNSYHQDLFADSAAKTARNYRLVYPDSGAATESFSAMVNFEIGELDAEGTNPMTLSGTLVLQAGSTVTW